MSRLDVDLESARQAGIGEWPVPDPISSEATASSSFPVNALGPLRQVTKDIQDATKCPIGLASASVLATAAFAAQGICDVEFVKQTRRPLSLFIITVGASGERKSSADHFAQLGVRRHVSKLQERYRMAMTLAGEGDRPPGLRDPNIVIGTGSVEGIGRGFSEGHPSQALFNDEGGAFLGGHSLKKENKMAGLAALSKFWDGNGYPHRVRGQGPSSEIVVTLDCRLTTQLLGQRVAVMPLIEDGMARGQGLLARFLVHEPKSTIGTRFMTFEEWQSTANTVAIEKFADDVEHLLGKSCPRSEEGDVPRPRLNLSDDASRLLYGYAMDVERELAPLGNFAGFGDVVNKVHEQAARIAGTLAVFREEDEVAEATMADAVEIAEYFLSEVIRLMSVAPQEQSINDAVTIANWLHGRGGICSINDFSQRGPKAFRKKADREDAIELLKDAGWLRVVNRNFELNPRCEELGVLFSDAPAKLAEGAN